MSKHRIPIWTNNPFVNELQELTDIAINTLYLKDEVINQIVKSIIDRPERYSLLINYEPDKQLNEYIDKISYWGDVLRVDDLEKNIHIIKHYLDNNPSARSKISRHLNQGEKVIFNLIYRIDYNKSGPPDDPLREIKLNGLVFLMIPDKIIAVTKDNINEAIDFFIKAEFRTVILN